MNIYLSILAVALLFTETLSPQNQKAAEVGRKKEKLEDIMRIQDRRTVHDGQLVAYLSDTDSEVREKAILAYGSIQDTSAIMNLADLLPDDAAAFAIGQTAQYLCEKSRESLQHDLIWNRIRGSDDRLIEEIGKFGTEKGMNDLILRFGSERAPVRKVSGEKPSPLTMSIARFAIRGIVSADAVNFLVGMIKQKGILTWETMYALQRIGNRSEIRNNLEEISQLYKHRDPLVRMNLAILLGKVIDEKICAEPLLKLADFDTDWRVRVNALRSLGRYDLRKRDDIVQAFKRSFFSDNVNVSVAAIAGFGNTGLRKESSDQAVLGAFSDLEKISLNKESGYLWQLQAEAAAALAKLEGREALQFIQPDEGLQPVVRGHLLIAAGMTGSPGASDLLFKYIGDSQPILYRSALEGLLELCRRNKNDTDLTARLYETSIGGLKSGDVSVRTVSSSILGDSLFLRETSVDPLLQTLAELRTPDDLEAVQEIISTLGKLKSTKGINVLADWLNAPDLSISTAAAAALKKITGNDYSAGVSGYSEPVYTDYDFKYLNSLPDTVKVKMETIRGDVIMELYKNHAPFTVMNFLKLAMERSYYRALTFHRIVPNFVVQGGDPRGDGWGGPGYSIRSEFPPLAFGTGSVGMASSGKDTEGSQFFITHSPQPHLDGRYTNFGKVIHGIDVVDRIRLDDPIRDIRIIE